MRKITVALLSFFSLVTARSQDLSYYLPDSVSYSAVVPKPKEIIYHEVGEWHVTHDRLVNYMKAIAAAAPERVKLETMGFSYEQRPQVLLIITSPRNQQRLEEIRQEHIKLTDPSQSSSLKLDNMPVVVWIGHSIHGNEPSGANASMLTAYYLAAAQGKQIDELLDNVVVLLDPSFNPDDLQRFSTWANQHKSKNLVSDPASREFNEVWPGGRYNHYWFDLNRDWLPAVHPVSRNRLTWFHLWKPNILTDHHEQGSNATFFFQPGVPSRVNPLTSADNQDLTAKLATFHAAFLDRIGSLYFTKESYDDFYYGKGSTYPDVQGCVGILFEQASSRGHLQQTSNGLLSFPFTIKNQFVTALSTLEGAKVLRKEFLGYQRDFFKQAVNRYNAYPVKGYVFGDKKDKARTFEFASMLKRHMIELNELPANWNDNNFEKGSSFIVSLNQPQHSLIRSIFEKTLDYRDSIFYDITAWTMPLAFGLPYKELNIVNTGARVEALQFPKGEVVGKHSSYAYLMDWDELYAPAALYEMLNAGLIVKVATQKFELPVGGINRQFDFGTINIPVHLQNQDEESLALTIHALAEKYRLKIYALAGGHVNKGIDLGSNKFITLQKPSVALLTGQGANAIAAGEVWHLLDQRMNIPVTQLEQSMFNRSNLNKYNTLIIAGGSYNEINKDKLKEWVQQGGTLILTEEAVSWASLNGINNVKLKKVQSAIDSTKRLSYIDQPEIAGAQNASGAIFGAATDLSHPLAYGYHQEITSLFKDNRVYLERSKNPFANPFYYGRKPLQSGWLSVQNMEALKNSAAVLVNVAGNGRIINITDNPNFRGYWLGGTKLFMNAIFFGRIIDPATARTE